VAFYGSTPNYAFVFEQLGAPDTTSRIRERQKAGDPAGMAAVVTDELLQHFAVTATWDGLADAVIERYGEVAARVVFYFAGIDWGRDPASLGPWGEVARDIVSRTG
jgi:hypothetical protein